MVMKLLIFVCNKYIWNYSWLIFTTVTTQGLNILEVLSIIISWLEFLSQTSKENITHYQ